MSTFIEVSTADLHGAALDWAVAKATQAEELKVTGSGRVSCIYELAPMEGCWTNDYQPSTEWSEGGLLIDRYQPCLIPEAHDGIEGTECSKRWMANIYYDGGDEYTTDYCDTALIAVCRAVVATKFGDTVRVPAELLESKP